MVRLQNMRHEVFSDFIRQAVESSMADIEGLGRWSPSEAKEVARAEIERLLPKGLATPNAILLEIFEPSQKHSVGFVWLSLGSRGTEQVAFIHQLFILPQHRRQGHAKATLQAIEKNLAAKGVNAIVLHVFHTNKTAQRLYASAGYDIASLNLQKKLSPSKP